LAERAERKVAESLRKTKRATWFECEKREDCFGNFTPNAFGPIDPTIKSQFTMSIGCIDNSKEMAIKSFGLPLRG